MLDPIRLAKSVCTITYPLVIDGRAASETANGSFITPNHVLTSWHIIERAKHGDIIVSNDNHEYTFMTPTPAEDILHSATDDLAIIKLDAPLSKNCHLPPVHVDTLEDKVSEQTLLVAAFQNQVFIGHAVENANLTNGYRDSKGITERFAGFATRAPIQPGFSGAPIINEKGEIISVLSGMPESKEYIEKLIASGTSDRSIKPFVGPTPKTLAEFASPFMDGINGLD